MSKKTDRIVPVTLKGFQDYLPEELMARRRLLRTVEAIFERYGFSPIETPALEYLEVLLGTGGEATNKELFRLESPEGESIALRFDLTVPFARLMAQYPDRLKAPFRRYAIGPVWRADKPGPGRFRQFTQCDIDIAGAPNVAADAEIVAVMCEVMRGLGVNSFQALVNNRKLIDALLDGCGITEAARQKHVLRVIDKLAKVGLENVRLELGEGRIDESGDPIPGVCLEAETIERILQFIAIRGGRRADVVGAVAAALPESKLTMQAIDEMRELDECLTALGVQEDEAVFDPSLARGLDYYTGPVFEMILPEAPEYGSVMGGGRYDGLVARFTDQPIPCTGMAIGLDRLCAALDGLGLSRGGKTPVQALVVTMGNVPRAETLRLAAELRSAGIRTETFFAPRKKMQMGRQLSHADHYGIPIAVIIGEDELAAGVVSIKDLEAGKAGREDIDDREAYREAGKTGQITVSRADMIETVRRLLGRE